MRSRSAYGDGPRGFSARSMSSASASSKPSAWPPPASSTTRRAGSELSPGGTSSGSRPVSSPMCAASRAPSASCRRSNSLSLSMPGSYRIAWGGETGARLAVRMARGLIPLRSSAERDAITRAKARLDRLSLYPKPVDIRRVRILHVPRLFTLPWFRRFDGYEAGPLIFLRHPLDETSDDLIVHELCHVWQSQHRMVHMALSYLWQGYANNRHEVEARYAAAAPRDMSWRAPSSSAARSAGVSGSSANARASPAVVKRRWWASMPSVRPRSPNAGSMPPENPAAASSSRSSSSRGRPTRYGSASWATPTTTSQPAAISASATRATATSSAGTSGAASSTGPSWPWTAAAAAASDVASYARSGATAAAHRRARAHNASAISAASPAPTSAARPGSGGAASAATTTAAGSVPGEMGPDRLELHAVEARHGGAPRARERAGAGPDPLDERLDRRGVLRLHAVRVVGGVAEQRVRDLRLAREHRLRPRRLADGGDAGGHQRPDLRPRVEPRAVDVAVAAPVSHRVADLGRGVEQHATERLGERQVEDPVPPTRRARLRVQRAERPVGEPVREEVQVVEDDERAQRELGIERAADRDGDDRVGATGAERRDVGAVGDLAREAQVAVAVARDVDDLGAGEAALGDEGGAEGRRDLTRRTGFEVRQRVRARPRDDPDPHRLRIVCRWRMRRDRASSPAGLVVVVAVVAVVAARGLRLLLRGRGGSGVRGRGGRGGGGDRSGRGGGSGLGRDRVAAPAPAVAVVVAAVVAVAALLLLRLGLVPLLVGGGAG